MGTLDELRGDFLRATAKPGQQTSTFMQNFVQMPESDGVVVVRILPPKSGRVRDLFCQTRLHAINNRRIHCPREIMGERWQGKCPLCEFYTWLWQESDKKPNGSQEQDALRAEARSLKPNERYYYNVIVRSQTGKFKNDQPNKLNTPLILSIGKQVHGHILGCMLGNPEIMQPELGEVFDVETGRDYKIVKKSKRDGQGRTFPDYSCSFENPSKLGTAEQVEEWLGGLHDLMALRALKTVDELKREIRIHKGLEQEGDGGFDPKEYEAGSPSVSTSYSAPPPAARVESRPAPAPVTKPKAVSAPDISAEDAALLEDEFLQNLN
jgi:hypothetical protein